MTNQVMLRPVVIYVLLEVSTIVMMLNHLPFAGHILYCYNQLG
jgi:hypothetical protein